MGKRIFRWFLMAMVVAAVLLVAPNACHLEPEADDLLQIRDALQQQGLGSIDLGLDGEVIQLGGEVPIAEFRKKAALIADQYRGDRQVRNAITVKPALSPYPFNAWLTPEQVRISGYVASSRHKKHLTELLESMLKGRQHKIRLKFAEGEPVDWEQAIVPAMNALLKLQEGSLEIAYRQVRLDGEAASREMHTAARQALEPLVSMGYGLSGQLTVALSCLEKVRALALASPLRFEQGLDTIKAESTLFLDELAALSRSCEETAFLVHGYTDSRGPAEQNLALSQARANAVVQAMLERGIPAGRFTAIGHGESSPVADNRTPAGRARNRRIEFSVKEPAESDAQ